MQPSNTAEKKLIEQLRQGDEAAYSELIHGHYTQIYSLCHRYLNNGMDAEEAAQDVFIQFFKSIKRYKHNARLSTYLYRLAVNRSLNLLRARKRRRFFSFGFNDETRNIALDDHENPDTQLEQSERAQAVRHAIDTLPANQRTAVILRRYQDLSYTEIAAVMQCSVSAVESRLHRAKQALSQKLRHLK